MEDYEKDLKKGGAKYVKNLVRIAERQKEINEKFNTGGNPFGHGTSQKKEVTRRTKELVALGYNSPKRTIKRMPTKVHILDLAKRNTSITKIERK